LLGFQCQRAFQEQFDTLLATSRQLSALALALMLLTERRLDFGRQSYRCVRTVT
jgi:hypothetical protein